ncbi:hypothetical protein QBC42DRAFT_278362 [Cladorrhinum samala]|uniref:Heme oxygenase n=1 Tax=Cladorrhinum samala TaxID=585594 RepID=A0AAV9HE05_9PEZI|nr:hypothetical protein QBC42DRAFT_278362 [Cladorrhinum samala]
MMQSYTTTTTTTTTLPHLHQEPTPHLGDSINIATRSAHTKLNKNLLIRLPLCVPPRACNPTTYASGLLHVAPVYIAFESAWNAILESHDSNSSRTGECTPSPGDFPSSSSSSSSSSSYLPTLFPFGTADSSSSAPSKCERLHSVLDQLRIEGLARSDRILDDIASMTGWSEAEVQAHVKTVAEKGRLKEFVAHIHRSIDKNPEVLLAYAWVLYMALFSGGRFIRSSLEGAGQKEFWEKGCDAIPPLGVQCKTPRQRADRGPLSFFRFDTAQDGEDLKKEFKRRFLMCGEGLLTAAERDRVVREAICIFDNMNLLVSQLDGVFGGTVAGGVGQGMGGNTYNRSPSSSLDSWAGLLIARTSTKSFVGGVGGRLRDSVAVAKERLGMMGWSRDNKKEHGHGHGHRHEHAEVEDEADNGADGEREGSLHAKGTLTSSVEQQPQPEEEEEKTAMGGVVKVVRFGSENAVLLKRRNGASGKKSVSAKIMEGGAQYQTQTAARPLVGMEWGKHTKETMQNNGESHGDGEITLTAAESVMWSLVLFVVVAGLVWGYRSDGRMWVQG